MNKTQFYRTILAGAVLGLAVAGVVNVHQASAAVAEDCRNVTVTDRPSPDSGEDGNNWATTTVDRKTEVCATEKPATGDWTYRATVTDTGTFETLAGNSPGKDAAGAQLKGGFKGNVSGHFGATFTAPAWTATTKLDGPAKTVTTGKWIETAFPGDEKFTESGSVVDWAWTYTTCGGKGEKWVNSEDGNSGDITEKPCPTVSPSPSPSPSASVTASPSPSASVTPTRTPGAGQPAPSQSTSSAGLPVTGPRAIIWVSVAGVLIAAGVAALTATRRRRDRFEA